MEHIKFDIQDGLDGFYEFTGNSFGITSGCWTQVPFAKNVFDITPQNGIYSVLAQISFESNIWYRKNSVYEGGIIGLDICKYDPNRKLPLEINHVGRNRPVRIHDRDKLVSTVEKISIHRHIKVSDENPTITLYAYQNSGVNLNITYMGSTNMGSVDK